MSDEDAVTTDAIPVALLLFQSKIKEGKPWTPGCDKLLRNALDALQRVEIDESEWEAKLCLTAFDILWCHVPQDVLAAVEERLDDCEREVLQRAVDKSVVRRISDLPDEDT